MYTLSREVNDGSCGIVDGDERILSTLDTHVLMMLHTGFESLPSISAGLTFHPATKITQLVQIKMIIDDWL